MAKDPAVLFYTQDFITGTLLMTDEQRGKYILLLCLQHQKGSLSEQDMLKICGTYDETIWAKFIKEGNIYFNRRMREESEKRHNYSESRRKNRKNVNDKSINRRIPGEVHMMSHMENENEDESVNIIVSGDLINKKEVKNNYGFLDEIIDEFVDAYGDYEIINRGKEREAAGKLLNLYKQKYPHTNSDETLQSLRNYFDACMQIQDKWIHDNMSLSLIINKYNEINSNLRNGNDKKSGFNPATYEQVATIIAKYFPKK